MFQREESLRRKVILIICQYISDRRFESDPQAGQTQKEKEPVEHGQTIFRSARSQSRQEEESEINLGMYVRLMWLAVPLSGVT